MNDCQISASGIKRCRNHRIQSRCTTWHTLFGIAQMMRVGLYLAVHVKTLRSQKLRMLLTHRKLLQSKAIAIDNDLRATLRNFGLKVGVVGTVRFEARIRELVENLPDLAALVEPLLIVRQALREQFSILHRRLLAVVPEGPEAWPPD
jgi:transposase